ncbi:uncharacterized protein LOC131949395 [Physella acuta]|uniref:uncharacterized protein LOC131949395 n=1 Tax=Physella acuta TaxID=109671 RepID=UPI0027DCBA2C|nr:uncharacterized protein LOC131949395 [Physella acuta]
MLENHLVYQKNPFENQHFFTINDTMRNRLHKYATTRLLPAYTYSPWYGESPQRRAHTVGVRSPRTYRSGFLPRHIDLTWEGFGRKKDACISFFDIETEKVSSYQYRPGEVVKGSINLIVNQNLEIRYLELVVTGKGRYSIKRSTNGLPVQGKESYLHKQTYVIGSGEVTRRSMLTPGHYQSKFCVKLPKDLPSSIRHADVKNGFSFDIVYSLKARLFDDSTAAGVARAASPRMLKVIMAKQVNFNVQRGFDLSLIPDVTTPITHTEKVYLSCNSGTAAKVTVHLERGVFLAGDDVRLQLLIQLHKSQAVKNIVCTLQEHVTLNPKQESVTFKLHQMSLQDFRDLERPNETIKRTSRDVTKTTYDVIVPTSTSILSVFSLGASQVKVTHSLSIKLRFTPVGGKLSFKIPVVIGPCAEPIYAEKSSTRKLIPIFNKPTRFPTFTQPALTPVQPHPQAESTTNVTSRYTHSCLAQCLSCCLWPR